MITFAAALLNARQQAVATYLDAGAGSASLQFWTSPRPAAGVSPLGTKLGEIVLSEPCGTVASMLLTLAVPQECIALHDNIIAWARLLDGSGAYAMDMDVSGTGGGGDIEVTSLTVIAGGTIRLVSAVFS